MRPLRPCNQPGCTELVRKPERYCSAHRWTEAEREQYERERNRERHRRYDRERRDQRAKAFYASEVWQRARARRLRKDDHLCVRCLERKRITVANTVDHIVPLDVDWDRRLDQDNLRSLCPTCHNQVRSEQRERTDEVTTIWESLVDGQEG